LSDHDLKTALLSALESALTPRLLEIDRRLRNANILILGVDYDILNQRVHFTIAPDISWRSIVDGTTGMMEHILKGVPGETVITDEQKEDIRFDHNNDAGLVSITTHHSYLLVDGTYRQELGKVSPVSDFLRAPPPQMVEIDIEV
jgi:hypothetical protein